MNIHEALKVALANTFVMYFQAHSYHWNVEGAGFPQYHSFFGSLYDELFGAIDPIAEHIRALGEYAPISIMDVLEVGTVAEDDEKPSSIKEMLANLAEANERVIESLNIAFEAAESEKNQGIMNFLADRLDIHAKHGWQLKSSLKALGK